MTKYDVIHNGIKVKECVWYNVARRCRDKNPGSIMVTLKDQSQQIKSFVKEVVVKVKRLEKISTEVSDGGKYPHENLDCTVRAIVNALGIDYGKAHEVLKQFGRKDKKGCNKLIYLPAYEKLAREVGVKLYPFETKKDPNGKEWDIKNYIYTVKSFIVRNPRGNYILRCKGHIFNVNAGVIKDSWEWKSGFGRKVRNAYLIQ